MDVLLARVFGHCGAGTARGLRDGMSTHLFTLTCRQIPILNSHYGYWSYIILARHAPRTDTTIVTQTASFCVHLFSSLPQDTVFSCAMTALLLRPIFEILGEVGTVRSPGQISLEKTKGLTLLGASLAVLSSTTLYINFGLYIVPNSHGKLFYANPYLKVLVFGINLDSVLNDKDHMRSSDLALFDGRPLQSRSGSAACV